MTAPTREQKLVVVRAMCRAVAEYAKEIGRPPNDKFYSAFESILSDYAPLTAKRRAELEARRRIIAKRLDDEQRHQNSERCMDRVPSAASDQQYAFFEAWLAELDAELEGGDA